jgi:hypothetical protein
MHPLTEDLSKINDQELFKKISDLTNYLTQSYRLGNYSVVGQIHMLLDDYNAEANRRHQKTLEETNKKNESLKDLIQSK